MPDPSQPTGAFVTLKEVVNSWRLKNEKPIHSQMKAVMFAAAGLRELSIHSLRLVKHALLTRDEDTAYWNLPSDFLDWVSVGIRTGEYWRPVGVATTGNMPMLPESNVFSEEFGLEFGSLVGSWLEVDGNLANPYFGYGGYTPYYGAGPGYSSYGGSGGIRTDAVAFDLTGGAIVAPLSFPGTELYLSYVGYGAADATTQLPRKAQACLEAYISWQWYLVKRNEQVKARFYEDQYYSALRRLRASNNDLTVTDIKRELERNYSRVK